ncbi:MAG: GNAT family N-acetyltransferase [Lachnospiraceae bacterium]|nr:GNAT family N-acetyltransferase [Lachnospiraceae bacterium]
MRNICLRTKRLMIYPKGLKEMEELYRNEKNPEMKQVYREMADEMKKSPGREEWASDWTISLLDGTIIGGIGFKGVPNSEGKVEIGYGIEPEFWNTGYATEAVKAMTEWALSEADVLCVQAQTEKQNEKSKRVLRKNGFTEAGMGAEGPLFEITREKKQNG